MTTTPNDSRDAILEANASMSRSDRLSLTIVKSGTISHESSYL